jgi:sugar transferase (PEP-CTERM/EpsH1 system associated)
MKYPRQAPLIAHVVHRFAVGGLENGVVNLINHLPHDRFRHAVICITEATDFAKRISRDDVPIVEMRKPPGNSLAIHTGFTAVFRNLRPDIVHTRNRGALEAQVAAAWTRVPVRIHGEHGWDIDDPCGMRQRYVIVRRAFSPFVHRYVALSAHIEDYLRTRVRISAARVERICNGVDCARFRPSVSARSEFPHVPFRDPGLVLVGTVGRLEPVKDQISLARAFVTILERRPALRRFLRLVIVGSGSLRLAVERVLAEHGAADLAWLAGERSDVSELLPALDLFVLPSRAEGISNTILEAMACGIPAIATNVGGNGELVQPETGILVPPEDAAALADAIERLVNDFPQRLKMASAARATALSQFSIEEMVRRYGALYDRELERRTRRTWLDTASKPLRAFR